MPLQPEPHQTVTLPALSGIIAASLTPIDPRLSIDFDAYKAHINWLFQSGCSFVSPFGSTGEGPSFSSAEKRQALQTLARMGVPMGQLVPAAMTCSVDETVAMIAASAELGCRAVLVVPPFYYGGAAQSGIAAFFEACAARLGGSFPIPVILYHIPALSRIPYGVTLIGELMARFPGQIVGIKDSTGDQTHTVMLAKTFPMLAIFTGDDRVLPALLDNGGAGMIGGMPNVVAPDLCAYFKDRNGPHAAALIDKARRRIEAVDAFGGLAALKAIRADMTGDAGWLRCLPPLEALDARNHQSVHKAFAETGFSFKTVSV